MKKLPIMTVFGLWCFMATVAFAQEGIIIPGERVGKFWIGMTRAEVVKIAPNPQENKPDRIHYKNYTTGNELIFFLLYNRVSGIIWTNQAWSTAETGITVRNFDTTHRGFFNPPRLDNGIIYYDFSLGGLSYWVHPNGARAGMVHRANLPQNKPVPSWNTVAMATPKQPLSFKDAATFCTGVVRTETFRSGDRSDFDSYVYDEGSIRYMGTLRERFSFGKCMNDNGHTLENK